MGFSYGYNRAERLEHYHSSRELIVMLADLVSRGGNLLLDIGPAADGTIPVIMEERLIQMGDWLKLNGDAIYGTKPWKETRQWTAGEVPKIDYNTEYRHRLRRQLAGRRSRARQGPHRSLLHHERQRRIRHPAPLARPWVHSQERDASKIRDSLGRCDRPTQIQSLQSGCLHPAARPSRVTAESTGLGCQNNSVILANKDYRSFALNALPGRRSRMGDRLTGEGIEMLRTVAIMAASAAFLASSFQAQAEISDQRMHDAAAVFHEMMAAGDQGIPSNLLEKAQCVVIVPGLKRARSWSAETTEKAMHYAVITAAGPVRRPSR